MAIHCRRGAASRAAATSGSRSTARPGSWPPVTAARSCCRRPRRPLAKDQLPDGATLARPRRASAARTSTAPSASSSSPIRTCVREFPACGPLDHRPNNLPIPVSAFVGREAGAGRASRDQLDGGPDPAHHADRGRAAAARRAWRIRAAADQLDRVSTTGVFFVDLAAVTDTESALAAIARVIGLTQTREQPLLEDAEARTARPARSCSSSTTSSR